MRRGRAFGRPRPLGRIAIVGQALLALVLIALILHEDGVRLPFASSGDWHVEVAFRDAGGLTGSQHAPVLVAGVPSGRVESVRYGNGLALARLRLGSSARGVVHTDAVATVEPRSALNDLTVNIAPGSPSAPELVPGGRLGPAHAVAPVALDRVVDVLDADTRSQVAVLLDQLAAGLHGQSGPLRGAAAQLAPTMVSANRVTSLLARRRVLLRRLVDSVDAIAKQAAAHRSSLAEALQAGHDTLAATASHDAALGKSVNALPATLASLDSALTQSGTLASPLRSALARLRPAARSAPAALAAVRTAAPTFAGLARDITALEREGSAPSADLAAIAPLLAATAKAVRDPVARVKPIVDAVNERKEGVGLLGERFSGVLSTNDANGPILRGLGTFEPFNPADVGFPGATGAQRAALAAKAVTALTNECLTDNQLACLVRYLVPGLPGAVR